MAIVARERAAATDGVPVPPGWSLKMRPEAAALGAKRHLRSLRGVPAQQARQGIEYDRLFGGEGALSGYLRELGAWARATGPILESRGQELAARLRGLPAVEGTALDGIAPAGRVPEAGALLDSIGRLAPLGARGGVVTLGRTRTRDAAGQRQAKEARQAYADILDAWSESAASLAMEGEARLDALARLDRLTSSLRALCAQAQAGDDAARELAVLSRLRRIAAAGDDPAMRQEAADRVRRAVLSVDPWAAESVGAVLDDAAGAEMVPRAVPAEVAERMGRWLDGHPQDALGEDLLRSRFGLGRDVEQPGDTMDRLGLTPATYGRRLARAMRRLDLAAS